MGQSGAPESDGLTRVNNSSSPKRVDVVMGRCFPLPGPSHQVGGTTVPVVRSIVYKDERGVPVTKTTTSFIRIDNHPRDRQMERQKEDATDLPLHPPQGVDGPRSTGKSTVIQQNGGVPSFRGRSSIRLVSSRSDESESHYQKLQEGEGTANGVHADVPKHRPILRRSQSVVPPETKETKSGSIFTDTSNTEIERKSHMETSAKEDLSGRKAWEITQKNKALLREEFFKVPYEECNREAARSLGGRLNKSEPRLHTVGKDRKKRNSLSYKRRVHFDLDDDVEDEKNTRNNMRMRHSRSFEDSSYRQTEVAPPKKVVVSIYTIDDGSKRVRQVDSHNNSCNMSGESPLLSGNSVSQNQVPKNKTLIRIKNPRPTDLDSTVATGHCENPTNMEPFKFEKQRNTVPSTASAVTSRILVVDENDNFKTNYTKSSTRVPAHGHSPPTLPPQPSVRPRSSSVASARTANTATVPPSSPQQIPKTNSLKNDQLPATVQPGPVPAPRTSHPQLSRCQSLQGYHKTTSPVSQPSSSAPLAKLRPDFLKLTITPTQTPSFTDSSSSTDSPSSTQTPSPLQRPISSKTPTISYSVVSPQTPTLCHLPTTPQTLSPTYYPLNTLSFTQPSPPTHLSSLIHSPTQTPSLTQTPSTTHSPSQTPTHSPSQTPTHSPSHSPTQTPSQTPSQTPTHSPSQTPTHSPSQTPTHSPSHSPSQTPFSRAPVPTPRKRSSVPQQTSKSSSQPPTSPTSQITNQNLSQSYPRSYHPTSQPSTQLASESTSRLTAEALINPTSQLSIRQPSQPRPASPFSTHPKSQPSTPPTSQPRAHHTSQPHTQPDSRFSCHPRQTPTHHISHYSSSPFTHPISHKTTHTTSKYPPHTQSSPNYNLHNPKTFGDPRQHRISDASKRSDSHPIKFNKENEQVKMRWMKTDHNEKRNSVNIMMTKGESYSKHNIILSSHITSGMPTVTVRKIIVPVSAPARCSPSPTPSCASSSCSFGSSGSSSGCFSGSPSPTPTPSPTRIRASGVPTDL